MQLEFIGQGRFEVRALYLHCAKIANQYACLALHTRNSPRSPRSYTCALIRRLAAAHARRGTSPDIQ
jgi:hypothetical protein